MDGPACNGKHGIAFFFLEKPEAIVALAGFFTSFFIMLSLFARFGFMRLLGLGHIPWLFTVPWLYLQLGQAVDGSPFYYWLLAVIVVDSISLAIDAVDVARYWMGERQPTFPEKINAY